MKELIDFQELILGLKNIDRAGWKDRKISDPESVADHAFSVSVLAMQLSDRMNLDTGRCLRMALLHELAETKIGDITPNDPRYKEKKELERQAIVEIMEETGSDFFLPLVEEYEKNITDEAKLVHDADRLEMLFQALIYERRYPGKDLGEFFDYVEKRLEHEESRKLFSEMIKKRKS